MYGWRGRLGLVLPADNTVVEVDLARRVPDGVSTHVVRLSTGDQRDEMPKEGVRLAAYLKEADISAVGYMCAASSFLLMPEGNDVLRSELSGAIGGLPAFTASTAMVDALRAVGATRVSVLSPHPPPIAKSLGEYLKLSGFDVVGLTALDMGLRAINSQQPSDVYREVRRMKHADADCVFVAATNFRAMEVIDPLEYDTGLPVITSNQACLWAGLQALNVYEPLPNLGRLFRAPSKTAK